MSSGRDSGDRAGGGRSRNARIAEDQVLLNEMPSRNGVSITPTRTPAAKRGGPGAADFEQRQPFLAGEQPPQPVPVRLTPAWEDANLPNDQLNFKELTMERAHLEMNPPTDRLNLVYLTLLLHGIGTLIAWNMFITAKSYFVDYKLSQNYTGALYNPKLVQNFMPYIGLASQIPNVAFNWINIFCQIGGNLTTRIVWSLLIQVVVFVGTVVMAMGDTSLWPDTFFWITMGSVAVINMANGIYQNTVFGMAAKLPAKYTGAVILGSNICGTFTSLVSIASMAAAPNARTAAIYYFIAALFVLLACMDTYFALPLNKFYRYHEMVSAKETASNRLGSDRVPYRHILRSCFPQCLNVFMIFFVSLTIFPTIHSDIKRVDDNFIINEKYFTPVTCFLTFNLCACIGSWLSTFGTWPSARWVWLPVWLRVLFIPLFLSFNYRPSLRAFPVLILDDWIYWASATVFGLTSGYLSSVCMMYCPRTVEPRHAATAGMFGAAFLITGIFCGILMSGAMDDLIDSTTLASLIH